MKDKVEKVRKLYIILISNIREEVWYSIDNFRIGLILDVFLL